MGKCFLFLRPLLTKGTPPLERVMPRPLPPEVRPDLMIELPPPTCDPTPWGCVNCQLELPFREQISPLPDRDFELTGQT